MITLGGKLPLAVTGLCAIAAVPAGGLGPPPDAGAWGAIGLTAILATAFAFVGQTWAQAHVSPTRVAVVLTLEPVFAGIFGVWVDGDRLDARTIAGAGLVLIAMLVTELGPRARAVERLEA